MPEEIDDLKEKIKDIKSVLLIKERDIIFSEFDESRTKYLSNAMHCLVTDIKEIHDFEAMMVAAQNGRFFIFNHEDFSLGVSSGVDTNFAFLKFLVRKAFSLRGKELRKKEGEEKGENEGKKEIEISEEDLPYFLKIACSDYYKKYPKDETHAHE